MQERAMKILTAAPKLLSTYKTVCATKLRSVLQVKVIPSTEGQTVTLMCSTSCPLTENPAAYIWYKNGEFVYEDWSPWYQELVSSEEAVRYSCAVKGYEDLRAPEVSVDSVSPVCFSVTYAKGKMCSYKAKSMDEPCTITYPTDVRVQMTSLRDSVKLRCISSCSEIEPRTAYRWYWNRELYSDCETSELAVFGSHGESISCAIKGNEDVHSREHCVGSTMCNTMRYVSERICALEGDSVNISSEYSDPIYSGKVCKAWYKIKQLGEEKKLVVAADRVEHHEHMENQHFLSISDLQKNDSAEYTFEFGIYEECEGSDLPGVLLVVTGLTVTMTPSAEVTEGQRVTLTCSTSCPLTGNTNYIWYFNGRPLGQNKHLLLDPVSVQ
ncbi:uncharacterized protein LOC103367033, partial [Stegastes partitus]|uniref:Uncharacterized protein LOC103367033 n=1 Tax=Stegastes partitus TaxID=144197 RepID=A0A9Y4KF15_9TELE